MRLTNKTRLAIIENWTKKKWQKRFDSLFDFVSKEAAKQITCLFDELDVSDEVKNLLIEKRVVTTNNTMRCYDYKIRDFSFIGYDEPFSRGVNVPTYYTRYNSGHDTFRSTDEIMKRLYDTKKEYDTQRASIGAILKSVTTDSKLFELLPECKKYMPKIESKKSTQLIAVDQIKQVATLM